MEEYWCWPEFWLGVCWVALSIALLVVVIIEGHRSRVDTITFMLKLMQNWPPPPPSWTDGEIFGSSGEISILTDNRMKTASSRSNQKLLLTEKTEEASKEDTETKKQETGTKNLDLQTDRTETGEFNAESGKNSLWWWLIGVLMAVIGIIYLWWKYGKKDKTK